MKIIAPSILSADFNRLGETIEMINRSKSGLIHVDVMDGHFVPNITVGIPVVESISKIAKKPIDVHLMITNPDNYIDQFAKAGASYISVHFEVCYHLHRTLSKIKENNCKAGIAINPHTPIHCLLDIIEHCDFVLIMSVNPGFGGQKFIENTYQKITELKKIIIERNLSVLIEVDGGINKSNCQKLSEVGVNIFVAGNSIFSSENPVKEIEDLNQLIQNTLIS